MIYIPPFSDLCVGGGAALPDISDAVGVPYAPSAGLKPVFENASLPLSVELG